MPCCSQLHTICTATISCLVCIYGPPYWSARWQRHTLRIVVGSGHHPALSKDSSRRCGALFGSLHKGISQCRRLHNDHVQCSDVTWQWWRLVVFVLALRLSEHVTRWVRIGEVPHWTDGVSTMTQTLSLSDLPAQRWRSRETHIETCGKMYAGDWLKMCVTQTLSVLIRTIMLVHYWQ